MSANELLSELPAGVCVLTAGGELCVLDAEHRPQPDPALNREFSGHARAFLDAYVKDPEAEGLRIAVLYQSPIPASWDSLTLCYENAVIRELYPVSGPANAELTMFQRKNRQKSLYRGMEALLDFRLNDVPVFFPVVFNPHATLAVRPTEVGHRLADELRDLPVLDVLNLLATLPLSRRATPAVLGLSERLREGLIQQAVRKESTLTLRRDVPVQQPAVLSGDKDAYAGIDRDRRHQRAVTLPQVDAHRLHETQRIEPVERWLAMPNQPVGIERLRAFAQFREFDEARLAELSARSLLYTAPPGTRLFEHGMSDPWNLYLLEGTVMLLPADGGATLRVDGGSDKVAYPVAFLKPRKYTVETLTPVSFLWIHDLLLQALQA